MCGPSERRGLDVQDGQTCRVAERRGLDVCSGRGCAYQFFNIAFKFVNFEKVDGTRFSQIL